MAVEEPGARAESTPAGSEPQCHGIFAVFIRQRLLGAPSEAGMRHCNPYSAKINNLNFQPLEVVSRYRDPQLQVAENYSHLFNFWSDIYCSNTISRIKLFIQMTNTINLHEEVLCTGTSTCKQI